MITYHGRCLAKFFGFLLNDFSFSTHLGGGWVLEFKHAEDDLTTASIVYSFVEGRILCGFLGVLMRINS